MLFKVLLFKWFLFCTLKKRKFQSCLFLKNNGHIDHRMWSQICQANINISTGIQDVVWFKVSLCIFFFFLRKKLFLVSFLLRREDIPVTWTEWFNFIYLWWARFRTEGLASTSSERLSVRPFFHFYVVFKCLLTNFASFQHPLTSVSFSDCWIYFLHFPINGASFIFGYTILLWEAGNFTCCFLNSWLRKQPVFVLCFVYSPYTPGRKKRYLMLNSHCEPTDTLGALY